MEYRVEIDSKPEDYYDKKSGKKVGIISGYKVIDYYYSYPEPTISGHRIIKYPNPVIEKGSLYYIEDVGIIYGTDYLIFSDCDDIKIINKYTLETTYTKNKRIASKFLKIEKKFSSEYIELNTIKKVHFVKKDNEEYISITYSTGWCIISPENILNYDEVEEILKKYVEE